MQLLLIGLRGSGKSTIGRRLASRLGRPFVDLDERTPRLLGAASVAEAWSDHGEPAFRAAEFRALRETLAGPDQIVALGGGTPTAPGAADLLREQRRRGAATIVYLAARPETLRSRLAAADNAHRPSLTGADPLDEIAAVLGSRDPLYRALADHVVETDGLTIDRAVDAVAMLAG